MCYYFDSCRYLCVLSHPSLWLLTAMPYLGWGLFLYFSAFTVHDTASKKRGKLKLLWQSLHAFTMQPLHVRHAYITMWATSSRFRNVRMCSQRLAQWLIFTAVVNCTEATVPLTQRHLACSLCFKLQISMGIHFIWLIYRQVHYGWFITWGVRSWWGGIHPYYGRIDYNGVTMYLGVTSSWRIDISMIW